ncbi:hydrogenase maturation protease [Marinobacter salinus]|nr:hydrogenase maturation protease [Marinobacter salinus]
MSNSFKSVRIIAIGNTDRGDDAVGPAVVQALQGRLPESVSAFEHNGEVAGLMDCMDGAEAVYLVDAAAMGLEPGSLRAFDASEKPLPSLGGAYSSHALGLSEAVELARALGVLPPVCRVFAVEAATFEAGEGLSAPVDAAIPKVTQALLDAIAQEDGNA